MSDANDSNSEPEMFAGNSDEDPNYTPQVCKRRDLVVVPKEYSDQSSDNGQGVRNQEECGQSFSQSVGKDKKKDSNDM